MLVRGRGMLVRGLNHAWFKTGSNQVGQELFLSFFHLLAAAFLARSR